MKLPRPNLVLIIVCLYALPGSTARAAALWVGPDQNCDHTTLQAAINALGSDPGPHAILLKAGTLAIPNGVNLSIPATNISILGAKKACGSLAEVPGERTILTAAGGDQGTAITIDAGDRAIQQNIDFHFVQITGGSSETGPLDNPEGGGLEVRGHVKVELGSGMLIDNNASGKGGGVYLRGASDTRRAELEIRLGTVISDNSATTRGGGVYCDDHGTVFFERGEVIFNEAETGGGFHLRGSCALVPRLASASDTGFNSISNNQASAAGGAIYALPNGNRGLVISLIGASGNPGNPIHLFNNTAPLGGGILFHYDGTNTVVAQLTNTIWVGQTANQDGAAAVVHMTGSGTKWLNIEGESGCRYVFFGIEGCSGFYDNTSSAGPGVIGAFWNDEVSVLRSRFEGNSGVGAIFSSLGGTFSGEALIVRNNTGLPPVSYVPPGHSLFHFAGEVENRLRYSTIMANDVQYLLSTVTPFSDQGAVLDVTGSILYSPGSQIFRPFDDHEPPDFVDFGCLLAHSTDGIPDSHVRVADPLLRADLSPGDNSPALDVCDNFPGTPLPDFFGQTRGVDQTQVPNYWGVNDLGAIERIDQVSPVEDALFSDRFESD